MANINTNSLQIARQWLVQMQEFINATLADVATKDRMASVARKLKNLKLNVDICASVKAGKSTCMNVLLGGPYLPATSEAQTGFSLCVVHDPSHPYGALFSIEVDIETLVAEGSHNIYQRLLGFNAGVRGGTIQPPNLLLRVNIPVIAEQGNLDGVSLMFWDTTGSGEAQMHEKFREQFCTLLESADVVIYLMDFVGMGKEGDREILSQVARQRKDLLEQRLYFAITKKDLYEYEEGSLTPEQAPQYMSNFLQQHVGINMPASRITAISAKRARMVKFYMAGVGRPEEKAEVCRLAGIRGAPDYSQLTNEQKEALAHLYEDSNFGVLEQQIIANIANKVGKLIPCASFEDMLWICDHTCKALAAEQDKHCAAIAEHFGRVDNYNNLKKKYCNSVMNMQAQFFQEVFSVFPNVQAVSADSHRITMAIGGNLPGNATDQEINISNTCSACHRGESESPDMSGVQHSVNAATAILLNVLQSWRGTLQSAVVKAQLDSVALVMRLDKSIREEVNPFIPEVDMFAASPDTLELEQPTIADTRAHSTTRCHTWTTDKRRGGVAGLLNSKKSVHHEKNYYSSSLVHNQGALTSAFSTAVNDFNSRNSQFIKIYVETTVLPAASSHFNRLSLAITESVDTAIQTENSMIASCQAKIDQIEQKIAEGLFMQAQMQQQRDLLL